MQGCGASTGSPPPSVKDNATKADSASTKAAAGEAGEKDLTELFKQFDTSGDGFLQIGELKRAFRAIGLEKRKGEKFEMDEKTFSSFDTNGDGKVSLAEFNANLHLKTRKKIVEKLAGGWKFDEKLWAASQERHAKWDMHKVFMQFDVDGDGKLTINELSRAFRALGLKKRDGEDLQMDQKMFASFDTNGDGFCSPEELEANLFEKTRKKIEDKLDAGWKFDAEKWAASAARHARWDMSKVFKQFDTDADGNLDLREFQRAFRALGLKKRDGSKLSVDVDMFKSFDKNGDGVLSLDEIEKGLFEKTRKKIEVALDGGWKFDAEAWAASVERHKNDPPYDPTKLDEMVAPSMSEAAAAEAPADPPAE